MLRLKIAEKFGVWAEKMIRTFVFNKNATFPPKIGKNHKILS
jgi:hypothetical protein